ncbi:MAG TPA: Asp-tRNA(Asn)/Glu-tRNA(Gln) amidotransferase subunit GatC [Actinomycetota bacterium]|jgi:aspartyl-tRNA(Asn)/glutamyl-tRNA(Gln) amidotransferase subunit C|nr:Asp-tRNA(Asn)/Glu-tRNA(Gln) amidotransferase subunit GatC [Actinomycetota bacterium]
MAITREEVEHVARLARLQLTPEETELFRMQLDAVLERATRIQSLDLDAFPPTAHPVDLRNVWREDVVVEPDMQDAILGNAPNKDGTFFRAPRILEEE